MSFAIILFIIKLFINLKPNTHNGIIDTLIGDITNYVQIRAQKAKHKINERFYQTQEREINKLPKLFPSLHLIPEIYINTINLLASTECKICKKRMSWYHIANHGMLMRNPEAVLQFKAKQWEELKNIQFPAKAIRRQELLNQKTIWTEQIKSLYNNSIVNIISIDDGARPLK